MEGAETFSESIVAAEGLVEEEESTVTVPVLVMPVLQGLPVDAACLSLSTPIMAAVAAREAAEALLRGFICKGDLMSQRHSKFYNDKTHCKMF